MMPPSSLRLCIALALMLAAPVLAGAPEEDYSAALCERALANGARRGGVPPQILHAISLTETGRNSGGRLRPWPWAINREGKGHWFKTRDEAISFARESLAQGRKSFDVGCTQINFRWHGHAFSSLEQMFDPEATATYAAQFLRNLYEERGSWSEAAGAYHSLTPDLAGIYRKRFDRLLAGLDGNALEGAGDMAITASRGSQSSRGERRAAEREAMVQSIRAARDDPPPDTVMGSMAAQAFEPANGGLLRGGSSLLTQGSPLLSTPAGSMF